MIRTPAVRSITQVTDALPHAATHGRSVRHPRLKIGGAWPTHHAYSGHESDAFGRRNGAGAPGTGRRLRRPVRVRRPHHGGLLPPDVPGAPATAEERRVLSDRPGG